MAMMRSTGWGMASVLIWTLSVVLGIALSLGLDLVPSAGLAIALAMGLGAVANLLLAVRLNSTRTPQGRRWHNRNLVDSANNVTMQEYYPMFLGFGALALAGAFAEWTRSMIAFVCCIALAAGLAALPRGVRELRRITVNNVRSREATSDLEFRPVDAAPRWAVPDQHDVITGEVYGVLTGPECTIFDAQVIEPNRLITQARTFWVAHLPRSLPRTRVTSAGSQITVACDNARFAADLVDSHYAAVVCEHGFTEWRIDGRDLIYSRYADPAIDVLDVVDLLVDLASLMPTRLLATYGANGGRHEQSEQRVRITS
ncbi:hypothetical protein D5S17_05870 [Pseudonocardiaceae bacterium YIM PH 21723]|nr:hypothetical protein D5S17_05870 [Pseudonocardiaceae bacterium YIM PH 21723]